MNAAIIIRPDDDRMKLSEKEFEEAAADLAEAGLDAYADNVVDVSAFYGVESYAVPVTDSQSARFTSVFRSGHTSYLTLVTIEDDSDEIAEINKIELNCASAS